MGSPRKGRSRTIAALMKRQAADVRVDENDIFPDVLIDLISHLPESNGFVEGSGEPPPKRQRTSPSDSFIAVAREEISFSANADNLRSPRQQPIIRRNVGSHLMLRLRESGVSVCPRPILHDRSVRAFFPLRQAGFSEAQKIVFSVAEKDAPVSTGDGAFWTSADLRLQFEEGRVTLVLGFELRWNESTFVSNSLHIGARRAFRDRVLETFFPEAHDKIASYRAYNQESRSPQDFYEAAFVTDQDGHENMPTHIPRLTADLYPFQRRAVQWLLNREGVRWTMNATGEGPGVVPIDEDMPTDLPMHFIETKDASGGLCYISDLFGVATRDLAPFERYERSIRGGILSEEMGLGKTLEIISLMLLHRRPAEPPMVFDEYLGVLLQPTSATLIITPPSLKEQWLSELQRHAPHLRVLVYSGIANNCKDETNEAAFVRLLASQDVVITTYNELKNELHFAFDPPDRAMRRERKHHRPKCPLVQLSWWRVCLDEAQEIESGVSNAATLARLIPRVNAWGVTGTPVKDGVKDLWGLLLFLRYDPYASVPQVWQRLMTSHKAVFQNLFNRIALRHTKRHVRDELALPPQKRYVITMPFTAIEEQHYRGLFERMVEDCGLDTRGVPLQDGWDPEEDASILEAMRTALDCLRRTALHPEVGSRNRRALGHKGGPMRTVAEVLDAMIEQSENAITIDQRSLLSNKLTRGQLLENSPRVKEALAIWEEVLRRSDELVHEAREQLDIEVENSKSSSEGERGQASRGDDDNDQDDEEKAVSGRVGEAQRRLRSALELQHKAVFFCANAHFQIKTNGDMTRPDSEEFKRLEKLEVDGYEQAKTVRREILQESHRKASILMERISTKAARQDFVVVPEVQSSPGKGLETRPIVESLDELGLALNDQANQLDEWRERIIQLLLKELVDEGDDVELTGEEYGDSTKVQEDLIAYITVLRAAIADRQASLSGQSLSKLTEDEIKLSVRLARQGIGPSPELLLRLLGERDEIRPTSGLGSLRKVLIDLRDVVTKLRHQAANGNARARIELEIGEQQMKYVQRHITEQTKAAAAMEQEVDRFTSAMNARVEYYRQLQTVSDMVAPYEGPTDDNATVALVREEENLARKIAVSEAKHRYLLHLKESDSKEEQQRTCVICQSPFSIGVLTVCGHQFCKECITLWFRAHHNCPVCKRRLQAANLHDITLKPQELRVHTETAVHHDAPDSQHSPRTRKTGIYADFSPEKLAEIKNIDLPGPSFTTKVDTMVRHLLWLRESDPGAKSIVFSQYSDFLRVLAMAFRRHQIGYAAFSDRDGIRAFKDDPGIECFLLHARAHSSGLNLVNASHVILCEPLLNTALELQAIARVDRIGQEHETTVWLYIVDGTVEESIYNLSVRRRMEHIGRSLKGKSKESTPELLDSSLEVANSLEMQQASLSKLMSKDKTSGEVVAKGDLWTCLFGNVSQSDDDDDERLRNDPIVRRHLAAEAADERFRDAAAGVAELGSLGQMGT